MGHVSWQGQRMDHSNNLQFYRAGCWQHPFAGFVSCNPLKNPLIYHCPHLRNRNPGLWKIKEWCAPGHTAGKWQNLPLNLILRGHAQCSQLAVHSFERQAELSHGRYGLTEQSIRVPAMPQANGQLELCEFCSSGETPCEMELLWKWVSAVFIPGGCCWGSNCQALDLLWWTSPMLDPYIHHILETGLLKLMLCPHYRSVKWD